MLRRCTLKNIIIIHSTEIYLNNSIYNSINDSICNGENEKKLFHLTKCCIIGKISMLPLYNKRDEISLFTPNKLLNIYIFNLVSLSAQFKISLQKRFILNLFIVVKVFTFFAPKKTRIFF